MNDHARARFHGAKALVFVGADLVVLERDHSPGIPWPGYLDLPGGGRDGDESPEACVLREIREEIGLVVRQEQLKLAHIREVDGRYSWFFAVHLPVQTRDDIVFGDEGAGWQMMPPRAFVADPKAIPHFASIVAGYLGDIPLGRR